MNSRTGASTGLSPHYPTTQQDAVLPSVLVASHHQNFAFVNSDDHGAVVRVPMAQIERPTLTGKRLVMARGELVEPVDAGGLFVRHWCMDNSESGPAVATGVVVTMSPVLRLAVAAYLARFKGQSRIHTESDLRGYLVWCELHGLDPLAATRPHIELYLRWLQEVRRFRPSTVSRRMSVVAGFYRTCVIDGALETRRPNTSAGPTCPPNPQPWG